MDWSNSYKRIHRATWEEISQAIHDRVTMEDALAYYAPATIRRGHRCPCPIHHGKDLNFSYTPHGFKCFVCGVSGDVVTFVKEVCELSTRVDAMKRIDQDFNLHLIENGDLKVSADLLSRLNERAEQAKKLEEAQNAWDKQYANLTYYFAFLDKILMRPDEYPVSVISKAKEKMAWIRWELDNMPSRPR